MEIKYIKGNSMEIKNKIEELKKSGAEFIDYEEVINMDINSDADFERESELLAYMDETLNEMLNILISMEITYYEGKEKTLIGKSIIEEIYKL